jgi:hypothetical protein
MQSFFSVPQSRQFQDFEIYLLCLHVPPFTFDVLSLSSSFVLKYVTAFSSAARFMATMASSETPWLIALVFLRRLGIICRSYSVPIPAGPPRVMTTTQSSCLPTSTTSSPLRMGYRAFAITAAPPRTAALRRCTFVWAAVLAYPFFRSFIGRNMSYTLRQETKLRFLQAPLASPIRSLPFGSKSDSHRLVVAHTGRTVARKTARSNHPLC